MPCRFPGPHPRGKLRGIWPGGGSPGTHPRGKLGGSGWGGSPGPHRGGFLLWGVPALGGACSRRVPAPGGASFRGCLCGDPSMTATAVGGTHPTGMHSYYYLFLQDWGAGGHGHLGPPWIHY